MQTVVIARDRLPVQTCHGADARVLARPLKGTWLYPLWMRRAVWNLWRRLGEPYLIDHTSYRTVQVDVQGILEGLRLSQRNLIEIFEHRAKHVIISRCDYEELVGQLHNQMHLSGEIRLGFNGRTEVFGMTVHFMPWYNGEPLLLPDLETVSHPAPLRGW